MPGAMLTEVTILNRGTFATAGVSIGGTVITVEDTTQFAEDQGTLDIVGIQYDYLSVNDTLSQITLATPLSVAVTEYDPVLVVAGGEVAQDFSAVLDLGAGDNVSVPITFEFRAQLHEGLYDPPVPVVVSSDLTRIVDIPGRAPSIPGNYLDPETLPDQVPTEPPAGSPIIEVTGLPSSIVIHATSVAQTTLLDYHVSLTPGFTPGPTTLIQVDTRSTVWVADALQDGTKFLLGTTYYFQVVAHNAAGTAAPSAEVSTQLNTDTVSQVIAAEVIAGFVLAGLIQVGNITLDPNGGLNIPLVNGGLISLPGDGSAAQFLRVLLQATSLLVEDNFELRGALSKLVGTFTMASGIVASSVGPTVTAGWDDPTTFVTTTGTVKGGTGLVDSGSSWVAAGGNGISSVQSWDKTTGAYSLLATVAGWWVKDLTKVGTDFYLLCQDASGTGVHVVKKYNSSWVYQSSSDFTPATVANSRPDGIASNGSTIYIAYNRWVTDDALIVRSMTTAGASQTTVFTAASLGGQAPGFWAGSADFGALRFVFTYSNATVIADSSGTEQTAVEWAAPLGASQFGVYYDGTNFRVLATSGGGAYRVWKLSPVVTSVARSVKFSKYDNDATGGTHETAMSVATAFTHLPRQWMRVSTPAPEDNGGTDDPNAIRHYVQTASINASYWRQTDVTAAPWVAWYGTPAPSGNNAVSTPDFSAVSSPGNFVSGATGPHGALIELKGSGTGRLDKLMQAGVTSVLTVANVATTKSIVFDVQFDAAPSVTVAAVTSVPGTAVMEVAVNNVTASGFDIVIYRTTAATTGLNWIALAKTQ